MQPRARPPQDRIEVFPRLRAGSVDRRPRVVHQLSHEARLARAAVYFEKTKGEWLEALLVAVVGYRNFPIYKQAGAL